MQQSDEERMHGHDERVPVASLHFGMKLIYSSVLAVAKSPGLSINNESR
jgi:acetylornithine deacetylase/succinyl-diaminopimelate desuccinylase-like protein